MNLNTKHSIQNSDKNEDESNPIYCSAGSNLYNSDAEDGIRLSACDHRRDRDQVEDEQVFPRIDNESFIQRLLLEGDQPESVGSARVQPTNKHGVQTQLIKFEDQQLEERSLTLADKDQHPLHLENIPFHRSLHESVPGLKKSEGASKILKIKGVGKAEDQKERLARYGPIQYLENHFHEKQ